MGLNYRLFEIAQRERAEQRRRRFTTIGPPQVGDVLTTRTNEAGKALVCEKRDIIACLASGDRLRVFIAKPHFRKYWGLSSQGPFEAVFSHGGAEDVLIVLDGPVIPVQNLSRQVSMCVISVVPRRAHVEPTRIEEAAQTSTDQFKFERTLVTA